MQAVAKAQASSKGCKVMVDASTKANTGSSSASSEVKTSSDVNAEDGGSASATTSGTASSNTSSDASAAAGVVRSRPCSSLSLALSSPMLCLPRVLCANH